MKITKEHFSKLNQLDRIEYRQKREVIQNWYSESWGAPFLYGMVFLIGFCFLIIPQGYSVWGIEFVNDVANALKLGATFFFLLALLGFIADMIKCMIRYNNMKELNEEYFNIKVKK